MACLTFRANLLREIFTGNLQEFCQCSHVLRVDELTRSVHQPLGGPESQHLGAQGEVNSAQLILFPI